MATASEQLQVNLGVANANKLTYELGITAVRWDVGKGIGAPTTKKVAGTIVAQFSNLVNQYLKPLYSSSIPLANATVTVTAFTIRKGYLKSKFSNPTFVNVPSLNLWDAQYVAWSIQLPTILSSAGITANKSQPIISAFNTWYTTNIVPLIPSVRISGVK